jgi:DNA-binding YbaB/EbfC family protein
MFKELGQFAGLMKHLPKIQEEMANFQARLGQITAEADAGGGMVKVKVNGRKEILSCTLTDEAVRDKEVLEDLIPAAVNQALTKVNQQVQEEMARVATGLGLPAGFALPGM